MFERVQVSDIALLMRRADRRWSMPARSLYGPAATLLAYIGCIGAHAQTTSPQTAEDASGSRVIADAAAKPSVTPLSSGVGALPEGGVANAALPPAPSTSTVAATAQDPYQNYKWKGLIINLPSPSGTIDGGLGGWRQRIADDYGIGYIGSNIVTFYDNILRHNHHGTQVYAGQKPTVLEQNIAAVTLDLSRYGIPDGQIVVEGAYGSASFNSFGPTTINLGTLSYFQTLFNKRLEIKAGLLANNFEYVGTFVGGSLSGGIFGPNGSLFNETGGTALSYPSYGINLTGHITRTLYDKAGIARGLNPGGVVLEHNFNPTGTRFSTPNTGAWVINEFGYLHRATLEAPQTWIRAGGVYSGSHYVEEDHPTNRSSQNYFLYLLGDRQIIQVKRSAAQAYRGLYAGFSVEHVPPNLNLFSQYYEARLYGLGLLPQRPFDQQSLILTDTFFSNSLVERQQAAHGLVHTNTKAITASYSYLLFRGFYVNAAVSFVDNPTPLTYTSSTGSAFNILSGIALYY